jgi:late competence protein required for DNA uptake (superfamily II DNA/RNA helicase)
VSKHRVHPPFPEDPGFVLCLTQDSVTNDHWELHGRPTTLNYEVTFCERCQRNFAVWRVNLPPNFAEFFCETCLQMAMDADEPMLDSWETCARLRGR